MQQKILSVGIDLGTTTTQIIVSQLYMDSSDNVIPEVKIIEKKIIYRSDIYFTPIETDGQVDLEKLKKILMKEYKKAGINKENINTGAVIITGETARKKNAQRVLHALSQFAGDFVAATAGPDLESVLAGYGAGAAEVSKNGTAVLNFDIGGGTTNAVLFADGEIKGTFALDIGGRLIKLNKQQEVVYISEKLLPLISKLSLKINVGRKILWTDLCRLAQEMADILFKISEGNSLTAIQRKLFISNEIKEIQAHKIMFSGGVAEFIYKKITMQKIEDIAQYGDIGPLLGQMVREKFTTVQNKLSEPREKIRATVIGAGNYSMNISGSTVIIDDDIVPLKNIPVLFIAQIYAEKAEQEITEKLRLFPDILPAIAFSGPKAPSYEMVKKIAQIIIAGMGKRINKMLIILLENDFAKALGMILKRLLPEVKIICLDCIKVHDGDYVDIGKSVGKVVPVTVKTLIF